MKRILLLSTILVLGFNTNAQTRRVTFAGEKGINLNNLRHNGLLGDERAKIGFHKHFLADIPLIGGLSVQAGLGYTMKGAEIRSSVDNGTTSISSQNKLTLSYIELPVNLVYSFGNWEDAHMFIGAGPYAARLMSARIKNKTVVSTGGQDDVETKDIRELVIGNADNKISVTRFDFGVNALVGYQTRGRFYFKAGASVGFTELNSGAEMPFDGKNANVSFTVGRIMGCNSR